MAATSGRSKKLGFTVDTQLFRELGELLVGRDSTALAELIKNAYDADATRVTVQGESLMEPDGTILIRDDGVGMTRRQFQDGFLRIAARGKTEGERRSPVRGRRYTGEKGIGRLAAHKLARQLDIRSVAAEDTKRMRGKRVVRAKIDWDQVEKAASVDRLTTKALTAKSGALEDGEPAGTTLRLRRLRHLWTETELGGFVRQVDSFEAPELLVCPPLDSLVTRPLLFEEPQIRDGGRADGFEIELLGDFDIGEDLWQDVANAMSWIVEMEGTPKEVHYAIAPTVTNKKRDRVEPIFRASLEVDKPKTQPAFQARILVREGATAKRTRAFRDQVAGVRVYLEGFRVAGYGEGGNDWLDLDADYTRRSGELRLDHAGLRSQLEVHPKEILRTLPNNNYLGAVFLTHRGAEDLQILVNREGFVASPQLEALRKSVRTGLDLLTRLRAGLSLPTAESGGKRAPVLFSSEERIRDGLEEATEKARQLRTLAAAGDAASVGEADGLLEQLEEMGELSEAMSAERNVLRNVAAVGTQMAAFVHEIENIVATTASLERILGLIAEEYPESAEALNEVRATMGEVRDRVDRQASYLTDVTTIRALRRRRRMSLSDRIDTAARLLSPAAERLGITIENRVDEDLRTPAMYPAEITTVLTNLLSNAVRAAGKGGRVTFSSGGKDNTVTWLRVENTGRKVNPKKSEHWFQPFESTSIKTVDPLLGQGMGLGLPITRSTLTDYGAKIRFIAPHRDRMKTALEIRF